MLALLRRLPPERWLDVFILANVAFLGLDIVVAHAANDFERPIEWAPVGFSAIASALLLPRAFGRRDALTAWLDWVVAAGAVAVGLAGMVFHLQSAFFEEQTLRNLVYSAPFVAPLSYVGVGLLLFLTSLEDPASPAFGWWILVLALGGFVGNFALALFDHAQNAFFRPIEWVSVGAAAFGVSFLVVAVVRPGRPIARVTYAVLGGEALVGLGGFVLHTLANVHAPAHSWFDRVVFGAPAFAPLLFTNLALLGALGLWAMDRNGALGATPRGAPN